MSAHLRAININMANKDMFTIPTDASIVCIDVRFIWFAFSINIILFVPNGIFISVCHYCNHWKQLSKYFVSYVSKNIWMFYFSTTGFLLSKLSATLWHFNNIIFGCFYLWPQHLVHLVLPKCCLCGFCFCFVWGFFCAIFRFHQLCKLCNFTLVLFHISLSAGWFSSFSNVSGNFSQLNK